MRKGGPKWPFDLRPHPLRACLLLGILLGEPTLKVRDEVLSRGDQRLLLRDKLAELALTLFAAARLLLKHSFVCEGRAPASAVFRRTCYSQGQQ